jgi:HAD superfamily hydrolase (TIGR01509 family)
MDSASFTVRQLQASDREWVLQMMLGWGADFIVSRGRKVYAADLPGLCAVADDGRPIGLATYEIVSDGCELVTLDALEQFRGVGTALVLAVRAAAVTAGCRRLWLITTNDNLDALRFYQRRDFKLAALRRDSLQLSRRLKPSIPLVGNYGICLRDEIELEMSLSQGDSGGAVIFDMDGVILDSNETWDAVMGELFAEYGKKLSDLDPDAFMGGDNSLQWAAYLRRMLGLPLEDQQIVDRVVNGILSRYSERVPLIPGAAEAVARMAARFPLGLASSSPRQVIAFVLQRSGLDRLFQAWVSSDDVDCGKPAPDVYLRCCELLGRAPENCVAVEDSRFGIQAAKAAGLKVIAVHTPVFPLDAKALALADVAVDSIDQLLPEMTESLFGSI